MPVIARFPLRICDVRRTLDGYHPLEIKLVATSRLIFLVVREHNSGYDRRLIGVDLRVGVVFDCQYVAVRSPLRPLARCILEAENLVLSVNEPIPLPRGRCKLLASF